eukprot:TRINITY_DN15564_c0_g1_i1.p1 TRINITY_DN15564_c0_g1~~TRINITY_DN15564_c0_g1_i1.p1  ORF type:complete len:672 (+),score=103.75 TRINITY_DN15564_c0_g1_i1:47-2062(+)
MRLPRCAAAAGGPALAFLLARLALGAAFAAASASGSSVCGHRSADERGAAFAAGAGSLAASEACAAEAETPRSADEAFDDDASGLLQHLRARGAAAAAAAEDEAAGEAWSGAICHDGVTDIRRRRRMSNCYCRRRQSSSDDMDGIWRCDGDHIVGVPSPAPSPVPTPAPPPEMCNGVPIQRRRRQGEICSCRRRSRSEHLPAGWMCNPYSNTIGVKAQMCHTVKLGEFCYEDVYYAKHLFITKHPDWYLGTGLTANSSMQDFQAYLTRGNNPTCPLGPCSTRPTPAPTVSPPVPVSPTPEPTVPTHVPSEAPTEGPTGAPTPIQVHSAAHSLEPLVPPLTPSPAAADVEATTCTAATKDPYSTGEFVPCCRCLQPELGQWGSARYSYRCRAIDGMSGCGDSNRAALAWDCARKVPVGNGSVWSHLNAAESCRGAFRQEGSFMCVNGKGVPDPTSIGISLKGLLDKTGCFAWSTLGCGWQMLDVRYIEFDVEWQDCDQLWFAPLWFFSDPWIAPQGRSGEIDLLESCRSSRLPWTLRTSIICKDHPDPHCFEPHWGSAVGSDGPQHFFATIADDGTFSMVKCNVDRSSCTTVSNFPRFLETVYPTTRGRDNLFHFVSDIWNGGAGDDGWQHCGQLNRGSRCSYTVANIRIIAKDGSVAFPSSKCSHLTSLVS